MTTASVRYPDVTVQLSGQDGNTFSIIGRVGSAMRRAGHSGAEVDAFYAAVEDCPDYDAVLQLVMATVVTR